MFDLLQQMSLFITSMPMSLVAKLGSSTLQPVIELIAAQNGYIHLSCFFLILSCFFLLYDRMARLKIGIGGVDCRFRSSNSARSIYFYIALIFMALAVAIFLKNLPDELVQADSGNSGGNPPIYPKEKCGDDTSHVPIGNQVYMYPIFVDGGDRILQKIKTDFCRDAFRYEQNGMIQVASFIDKDSANDFRSRMETKFGHAEVGAARLRTPNR